MTLIAVLIGLALEHFLGTLDHIRHYSWFDNYTHWLNARCSAMPLWDGPLGVLVTLALPLLLLGLVAWILSELSVAFVFLLAIAVFVYSLGPDINNLLSRYIDALEQDDEDARRRVLDKLNEEGPASAEMQDDAVVSSFLLRSHENFFGVLFWFILLGMSGAFLYRLMMRLYIRYGDVDDGFGGAVRALHAILMWPSCRLQALGFGVGGSLVHTIEAWRDVEGDTLEISERVLVRSGLGALQYEVDLEEGEGERSRSCKCLAETRGLLNRTLIVWLTVLGIMTIGGYLV